MMRDNIVSPLDEKFELGNQQSVSEMAQNELTVNDPELSAVNQVVLLPAPEVCKALGFLTEGNMPLPMLDLTQHCHLLEFEADAAKKVLDTGKPCREGGENPVSSIKANFDQMVADIKNEAHLVGQSDIPLDGQSSPNRLSDPLKDDVLNCKSLLFESSLGWETGFSHSPEELKVREYASDILACAMHASNEHDEKLALFTKELDFIVYVIQKIKGEVGISELAVAILVHLVIDQCLYKLIKCCNGRKDFFNRSEELLGISPSHLRDMNLRGASFIAYQKDLLNGVDNGDKREPGITLEELATKHLSKLTLYSKVARRHGRVEALRRLKTQTFTEFQRGIEDTTNKRPKNPHVPKPDMPSDLSQYSAAEKEFYRVLSKGGYPFLVNDLTEVQVQQVKTQLHDYHQRIMDEWHERHAHRYKPYDPANPLKVENDLYDLDDITEIIPRIRAANNANAPKRRTIAVLMFRLSHEETLKSQWQDYQGEHNCYTSFARFSMEVLGFGEDFRDYVRAGRILWEKQYYRFLDGLSINTDAMFYKLRYLDAAMKNHNYDEVLIHYRLHTLSVREFALFSRSPDFESSFVKPLTRKKRENFTGTLETLAKNRNNPLTHIIELHNYDELGLAGTFANKVRVASAKAASDSELTEVILLNDLLLDSKPDQLSKEEGVA